MRVEGCGFRVYALGSGFRAWRDFRDCVPVGLGTLAGTSCGS